MFRLLLALSVSFTLIGPCAYAASSRELRLDLPRTLGAEDNVWLEVHVGPIARGQEIELTTPEGVLIGTVSPYGVPPGRPAGIYVLPVRQDLIKGKKLTVRIAITLPAGKRRAPTDAEFEGIELLVTQ